MGHLDELNSEQREAVTTTEGYIRIIAGAGSGKTRALTSRYAYLVGEAGVSPNNILCVTFTNKAASVMKNRIQRLIGETGLEFICTFHGYCVRMLKRDITVLGYPRNFTILDQEDQKDILKEVYEELGLTSRDTNYARSLEYIRKYKLNTEYIKWLIDPNGENLKGKQSTAREDMDKILYGYLSKQRVNYGLDFDDLINFALYLLENDENVRDYWQKKFCYIMVDEFQDVSGRQYAIAAILSGYHNNLFVVGDPDQTIYTWRGARVEYILNFDKKFPTAKTIMMNRNYRSTPNILYAANALIKKNKARIDKDLITDRSSGTMPLYCHTKNDRDEGQWISDEIKKLINVGAEYSQIAIMYRAHYCSRHIEESLILNDVPYILYSGIAFYQRKEIKDALSYMRLVLYGSDIAFLRVVNVPKRGIGKKRLQIIKDYAEQNVCSLLEAARKCSGHSLLVKSRLDELLTLVEKYTKAAKTLKGSELLTMLLNESGLEEDCRLSGDTERIDNLAELKAGMIEFEKIQGEEGTAEDYLEHVALLTTTDRKERESSVKLMTVHVAKGMEFPYVFVCGLSEGIFPIVRANTILQMEEERRLAYVAFTRAEKRLYLSDAEGATNEGSFRMPSRFIFNTGHKNLNYVEELSEEMVQNATDYIIESEKELENGRIDSQYKEGDLVVSAVYGRGEILAQEEGRYLVKFSGIDTPRSINSANLKVADEEK